MAYNKKTWANGDLITKESMNNIENGIYKAHDEIETLKNNTSSGTGITPEQAQQLSTAYQHSQTTHVQASDIPSKTSDLTNDSSFATETFVTSKIAEASVGGEVIPIAQVEPTELDMPKVFFYGNALPTTKYDVNLTMDYISNTGRFSAYIKLKCQGSSSMKYDKKNFTITMYEDADRSIKLKKDFKGWGNQYKFCLKANYVDTTHTRNISGARIGYDMVQSRPDSTFKQQLLTAPRGGAIDGFPIKLYFNGEFYGIYTWNIPKDDWMFNMDVTNPNHMVLCAKENNDGTNTSDDILRCEFRKEWDGTDGNSWSIEIGTYSDALKNSFNRCVSFVMTATDEEFKTNIGQYFDLYSLLDYYCFSYFTAHIDGLAKNMLMATYDGVIWGTSLYDMDSIYGADWNGTSFKATDIQCPGQYQETNSLLWQRIEQCFETELYARYLELRQGALSLSNIIKHVEEIYDVIPDRVFADEKAKWTALPGVSANTMTRFRNYMRDRAKYVDEEMKIIAGLVVPCTGITLDKETLTFDSVAKTNLLEGVSCTQNKNDYNFTITLEPGTYRICNINGGQFKYIGYKDSNGKLYENKDTTDDYVFTLESSETIIIKGEPNRVEGVAEPSSNLALYKEDASVTTEKLTATLTPSDCNQEIIWSVSPSGVVTVVDGVVTPIATGACTITATCGAQSATCNVTVSGMSESGGILQVT